MRPNDFTVGDIVEIPREPRMWSSYYIPDGVSYDDFNPIINLKFPYIGEIRKMKFDGYYWTAMIHSYGFSLSDLCREDNIIKLYNVND